MPDDAFENLAAAEALGESPAETGAILTAAHKTGFSRAVIRALPANQRMESPREFLTRMAPHSPGARYWLAQDVAHAQLARDQLPRIAQFEAALAEQPNPFQREVLADFLRENPQASAVAAALWRVRPQVSGPIDSARIGFTQGMIDAELSQAEWDTMTSKDPASQEYKDAADTIKRLSGVSREMGRFQPSAAGWVPSMMAQTLPYMGAMITSGLVAGGATAAVGAAGGAAAGIPGGPAGMAAGAGVGALAGFGIGMTAGSFGKGVALYAGHLRRLMKDEYPGMDPAWRDITAVAAGAVTAALDVVGLEAVTGLGKPLLTQTLSKAMASAAAKAESTVAGRIGVTAGTEGLTEGLQQAVEVAVPAAAAAIQDLATGSDIRPEFWATVKETASQSLEAAAAGMVVGGVLGVPASALHQSARTKDFEHQMLAAREILGASSLPARSQEATAALVRAVDLQKKVFLDPADVAAVAAQSPEMAALVGRLWSQSDREAAAQVGERLSLPVAALLEQDPAVTQALLKISALTPAGVTVEKAGDPALAQAEAVRRLDDMREERKHTKAIGDKLREVRGVMRASGLTDEQVTAGSALLRRIADRLGQNDMAKTAEVLGRLTVKAEAGTGTVGELGSLAFWERTGQAVLSLFRGATPTTFPHEVAHWFLREIGYARSRNVADAGLLEAVGKVAEHLGVTDVAGMLADTKEGRAAREAFSVGFEGWLAEGKAPTPSLVKVFRQYARWLMQVLTLSQRPKVSAELAAAYSYMLNVDAATASAVSQVLPLTPEELVALGVQDPTAHEWLRNASDKVREYVRNKVLAQQERKARDAGKAAREAEVQRQAEHPVYKARKWLEERTLRPDDPLLLALSDGARRAIRDWGTVGKPLASVVEMAHAVQMDPEELLQGLLWEPPAAEALRDAGRQAREQVLAAPPDALSVAVRSKTLGEILDRLPGWIGRKYSRAMVNELADRHLAQVSVEDATDPRRWVTRAVQQMEKVRAGIREAIAEAKKVADTPAPSAGAAGKAAREAEVQRQAEHPVYKAREWLKGLSLAPDDPHLAKLSEGARTAILAMGTEGKPLTTIEETAREAGRDPDALIQDLLWEPSAAKALREAGREAREQVRAESPAKLQTAVRAAADQGQKLDVVLDRVLAADVARTMARKAAAHRANVQKFLARVPKVLAHRPGGDKGMHLDHYTALVRLAMAFSLPVRRLHAVDENVPVDFVRAALANGATDQSGAFPGYLQYQSGDPRGRFQELEMSTAEDLMHLWGFLIKAGREANVRRIGSIANRAATLAGQVEERLKAQEPHKQRDPGTLLGKAQGVAEWYSVAGRQLPWVLAAADGLKDLGKGNDEVAVLSGGPLGLNVTTRILTAEDRKHLIMNRLTNRVTPHFEFLRDYFAKKGRLATGASKILAVPKALAERGQTEWTYEQLVILALHQGNSSNRKRVLKWLGVEQEVLDAIFRRFLPEQGLWETLQGLGNAMMAEWELVRRTTLAVEGYLPSPLPIDGVVSPDGTRMAGWYCPVRFDYTNMTKEDLASLGPERAADEKNRAAALVGAGLRKGFVEERTGANGLPLRLDLGVVTGHLMDQARYIACAALEKDVRLTFANEGLRAAWIAARGRADYDNVLRLLSHAIAPVYTEPSDKGLTRALDFLRTRSTAAALLGNVRIILLQTTSAPNSVQVIGARWMYEGYKQFVRSPSAAWAKVMAESGPLRRRLLGNDYDLRMVTRNAMAGKTERARRTLHDALAWSMIALDACVSIPTWLGARAKAEAELRTGRTNSEIANDFEQAIARADMAVQLAQGSAEEWSRSWSQIDGGWRLLFMFSSFVNALGNRHNAYWRALRRGDMTPVQYAVATLNDFVLPSFAMVGIQWLLWGAEADEWDWWDTPQDALMTRFAAFPVLRDVARFTMTRAGGGRARDLWAQPIVEGPRILQNAVSATVAPHADWTAADRMANVSYYLAEGASFLAGIPAMQIFGRAKKAYDAFEAGEAYPVIPEPVEHQKRGGR